MQTQTRFIIGIDEAGRGPLAGPVAVGAVLISPDFDPQLVLAIKNKDSKKLSAQKRELWYVRMIEWRKRGFLNFHVALVHEKIIDKYGITHAIKRGIDECLRKIKASTDHEIILDGSLRAPRKFIFQKTIIRGDEKEYPISLASIAAKVVRDRKMERLALKYPAYSFDIHKGYGTTLHRKLIRKFGLSNAHRKSFLKNLILKIK